jgi:TonB family protein
VRRAAPLALGLALLAAPAPAPRAAEAEPAAAVEIGAVAAEPRVEDVDAVPRGPSLDERLAEIRRRIQEAVEYPPLARRRRLEGVARVGFEIDPQERRALGVALVASSGHPLLDRAAERSVARAAALPWVHGRLEVPVRFALDAKR